MSNLGTGMRVSVHLKLPKMSKEFDQFKKLADTHHLHIIPLTTNKTSSVKLGLHNSNVDPIYDISNIRKIVVTEIETVQNLYNGVKALINLE
jgi:creatine kinase/arginine kinase